MAEDDLPPEWRRLWEHAVALHEIGHRQQAIAIYSAILAALPDHVPTIVRCGEAWQEEGDLARAEAAHARALTLDPAYGPAYHGRAWVRGARGDHAGELADAERGLALDPEHPGPYLRRRGHAYQGLGQLERALADLDQAVALDPCDARALYGRALLHARMGHDSLAMDDLDRALEIDPDWAWALCQRARVLYRLGDLARAEADLDLAIRFGPRYGPAYFSRAQLYRATGRPAAAAADYATAARLDPALQPPEPAAYRAPGLRGWWLRLWRD